MLTKTVEVNIIRVPSRLEPRAALAARILVVTNQWLKGTVPTGAKAATIAGCSLPTIDAARVVIESQDKALIASVLSGHVSLTAAAAKVRRRVRLIESFRAASAADRAELGRMAGADVMFDAVIVPSL